MSEIKNLYSISAERSVIGSLLIDSKTWDEVSNLVTESDFFRQEHQIVFSTISKLCDESQPFDMVTVGERLDRDGNIDLVGGIVYLIEVCENTPSISNAASYAAIVKEHSMLRGLDNIGQQLRQQTHDRDGATASQLIEESERLISELGSLQQNTGGFRSSGEILNSAVEQIEQRYNSGGQLSGLSTGLEDLDEITNGLQKKDLIILGGRPSMGKSALLMRLAEEAAFDAEYPSLVFSLEMPAEDLITRSLASVGRIDMKVLKNGKLEQEHWSKLMLAGKKLKDSKLMIDDTSGVSPSEMRSKARKIKREHGGVSFIGVDYLQLMQIAGYKEGRTQEISEISRSLKALAKEMDCPVVALSQLNRSLENRPNKRPINSDLRESGAIEQDADLIMFVYRDEVYHEDTTEKGIAEIIISKHRNGSIGTCRTAFLGKFARFENLSPESYRDSQNY